MEKLIILITLILTVGIGYAQDIHFSSWEEMPQIVNPAYAGSIYGNYKNRALVAHRKQWNSALGRADYETYYAAYDHKLAFCKKRNGGIYIGMGLDMYRDHVGIVLDTGDGTQFFEHNKVKGNFAFGFVPSDEFSIVAGASFGWMNYKLDDSQLTFDNQFGQYDYDPTLLSGEEFFSDNIGYMDIGAGFLLRGKLDKPFVFSYETGISFLHLNNANKKFLTNSNVRELLREYRLHTKFGFNLNKKNDLNVYFIHYKYGAFLKGNGKQWQINSRIEWKRTINQSNEFYLGGGLRLANVDGKGINPDALILSAKWKPYFGKNVSNPINNTSLGISYDINISPYSIKATNAMGSIEFFMSYSFGRDHKVCCRF